MPSKTRVTGAMDVQRLGQALARPGMDPRVWVTLAVVVEFVLDEEEGPLCNVLLMPDGTEDTVRVGALYAGPGYGLYVPLGVDDEVLVSYPSGEYDHGGVIVSRMWSKSDPPPQTAIDNKIDFVLHAKEDVNVRIGVSGQGKVLLGKAGEATKSVNREGDQVDMGKWHVVKFTVGPAIGAVQDVMVQLPGQAVASALPTFVAGPPAPSPAPELDGKTKHGSDFVEASD